MASQKSIDPTAGPITPAIGRAPKRQRGYLRVAAILRAASRLFAEQGYDAVTMTAIAAQADTAIGSLYRFFPTKESIAVALLDRYHDQMNEALAGLAGSAPADRADLLVDMMLHLRADRAVAVALLDRGAVAGEARQRLRQAMLDGLARLLSDRPAAEAAAQAQVILLLLKGVPTLAAEEEGGAIGVIAALRRLLRQALS